MKMHRIVTYVIDILENTDYINVQVGDVQTAEIGKWSDDHVLNQRATTFDVFEDYFK